jgi:hypothetical protein
MAVVEVDRWADEKQAEPPMSVTPTMPLAATSSPATYVAICCPGLKPSLRFHSVGSTWVPPTLAIIDSRTKLIRSPVSVPSSATVNVLLGNGSRQWRVSSGSQRSAFSTMSSIVPLNASPESSSLQAARAPAKRTIASNE